MGNEKMSDISQKLFDSEKACLIAPAGYGKTYTISKAVSYSERGKQLILTHTHAGIHSLKTRLKSLGVKPFRYEINTIAGWSFGLVRNYPKISEFPITTPRKTEWNSVNDAAIRLLEYPFMKTVIEASYTGLFVDEYQDCNLIQHTLVLKLAEIIPCRIVGDPLQGIFDFSGTPLNWQRDVYDNFEALPTLDIPYRWKGKNEQLGEWLADARKRLESNLPLDLDTNVINLIPKNESNQIEICHKQSKTKESVIAIRKMPRDCHNHARKLGGIFQSIDEMDANDLMDYSKKFEDYKEEFVTVVTNFLSACFIDIPNELIIHVEELKGRDIKGLLTLYEILKQLKNIKLYRAELWDEMKKALLAYATGKFETLYDAAWNSRQHTRLNGRKMFDNVVSRTLLIKGLEFSHAIVLDAEEFDSRNLYVALTRGSNSLTILSSSKTLRPRP